MAATAAEATVVAAETTGAAAGTAAAAARAAVTAATAAATAEAVAAVGKAAHPCRCNEYDYRLRCCCATHSKSNLRKGKPLELWLCRGPTRRHGIHCH